MGAFGHRKQIVLFLAAVIVPSSVLVLFTLRMMRQERELSTRRIAEERQRRAVEIGQHLLLRLEKIKLDEKPTADVPGRIPGRSGDKNPELVFTGLIRDGRLVPPWEFDPARLESAERLSRPDFSSRIRQGERAEFEHKEPLQAAQLYGRAMAEAREAVQRAFARLLLARSLAKSGRAAEAVSHYRILLAQPARVRDESGIPICLYAAERLLGWPSGQDIADRLRDVLEENRWPSPVEAHMIDSLLKNLSASSRPPSVINEATACQNTLDPVIRDLERISALQRNFQKYLFLLDGEGKKDGRSPVWTASPEGQWLLGLASSPDGPDSLVVVDLSRAVTALRRDRAFAQIYPEDFLLVAGERQDGTSLGPNFPGLQIVFQPQGKGPHADSTSFLLSLYLILLILVLTLTFFGAYLLWRDVRRDLRLAEMRSQFVSSVSHELKTPLTAIRMFAETLQLGRSKDERVRKEYLETIVNESERLSRLLNNVLDFSKIEKGKKIYRPEPASLGDIVRAASRAFDYPLSQHGFTLRLDVEEGMPPARVDRDGLEQAILNLLSNAMKYSGDSREIGLSLRRRDGWAVIRVSDHGIGIDPREQKRIFEKFYRVHSPENERIPGTGLGLAIVTFFIKAHGGRIEVESAPGRGSTFSLSLPLEDTP